MRDIPTTEDIRNSYASELDVFESGFVHNESYGKDFDRRGVSHNAHIKAEALRDGAKYFLVVTDIANQPTLQIIRRSDFVKIFETIFKRKS